MSSPISVDILEADAVTAVASVDFSAVVDGSIEDPIQGEGLGELAVGLESPNREDLEVKGRILRWNGTGTYPVHTLIEDNNQVSKADSRSQVPLRITVRGRGLIGQWDDVRVGQWPETRSSLQRYYTRHFNYASPGCSDRINDTSYEHDLVMKYDGDGQPDADAWPPPSTWRDPTAQRIWSQPYSGDQGVGVSLFRKPYTAPENGVLRSHMAIDDGGIAWLGGVPILKTPDFPERGWTDTFPASTWVNEDAELDLVVKAYNILSGPPLSIAWLGFASWLLPFNTTPISADSLQFHSDDTWDALELLNDPLPGWIVPDIVSTLLNEWQTIDQGLTGWEVIDGAEGEWDELEETNFECGKTTGAGVLAQLSDGLAEFRVRVDGGMKQLWCYPPGRMGNHHAGGTPPELQANEYLDLSHRWVQA